MHYGGDYNPEQFPEEVWHDDIRLMREAGVTMVTVGVFSWSRIQPAEDEFDWEWLDRILDLLHAGGIEVDLATATASLPPWAVDAYPEILPVDENGATYWPGSRQHYSPSSPDYRRLASKLVTAMVERYSDHPAVTMWHVNNEYGCHLNYDYSDNARDAFRLWLRERYGDVATLNAAWGTAFWSQIVTDFDQIYPPRKAPYSRNPAGMLDFKRFTSDTLLGLYRMERDIIRTRVADLPITTNFMGTFPIADYWAWAQEVDIVSDDSYPDPNDPESFRGAAFSRDLMRSLRPGKPWLLMEQAAGAVNWRSTNATKVPGQMAALSAQAIGRGADGILFFQWRQSRRGSEQFHSAMLPHSGTASRSWQEVRDFGQLLRGLPALPYPDNGARVALVFEWDSWWALQSADIPVRFEYSAIVQRWYEALHRLNVPVDIVRSDADLSGYRVVIAPTLYLLADAGAATLTAFVEGGGHLLVTAFTDIVDATAGFREGGFQVGLRAALGVASLDFGALVQPDAAGPGERAAAVTGIPGDIVGEYFCEELELLGAEVRARFSDGRRSGDPALTTHRLGAGSGHYLATLPDVAGTETVVRWLLGEAGVELAYADVDPGLEISYRGSVVAAVNHGPRQVTVAIAGRDVISGDLVESLDLEPQAWRLLETRP